MVPRRREMNGAEDDKGPARRDAGGIHRGDVGGGGDHEGATSPEALDPRLVRRRRDHRDGEWRDEKADDEKALRTGGEERNGKKVREEEVDGNAPQADHQADYQASLAAVLSRA